MFFREILDMFERKSTLGFFEFEKNKIPEPFTEEYFNFSEKMIKVLLSDDSSLNCLRLSNSKFESVSLIDKIFEKSKLKDFEKCTKKKLEILLPNGAYSYYNSKFKLDINFESSPVFTINSELTLDKILLTKVSINIYDQSFFPGTNFTSISIGYLKLISQAQIETLSFDINCPIYLSKRTNQKIKAKNIKKLKVTLHLSIYNGEFNGFLYEILCIFQNLEELIFKNCKFFYLNRGFEMIKMLVKNESESKFIKNSNLKKIEFICCQINQKEMDDLRSEIGQTICITKKDSLVNI